MNRPVKPLLVIDAAKLNRYEAYDLLKAGFYIDPAILQRIFGTS